jgi:hypothetical protein
VTRAELVAWLEARTPVPPETLRRHLVAAVGDSPLPLSEQLAEAGRTLLQRVVARPDGGRELALDLLAADALVTYAFEAQAEVDAAALPDLAERVAREGG